MAVVMDLWPCCGQPRGAGVETCTVRTVEIPGAETDEILASVPYAPDYGDADQRCHDCGVKRDWYHHPGCDMERCPKCAGQLIFCGCLDDDAYNAWQRVKGERDQLREAARSILWMAREYAEGGGRGGPEMQDYEAAAAIIGEQ
jgi:hypothetical protein